MQSRWPCECEVGVGREEWTEGGQESPEVRTLLGQRVGLAVIYTYVYMYI